MQSTANLLMIRPVSFGFNQQTAESNAFQTADADQQQVQAKAQAEFDVMVRVLRKYNVNVMVIEDTIEPHTPDSIFPNNWISFHENGDVFLYPMQAKNRRLERREDIINKLKVDFEINQVTDLSSFEAHEKFLEGTGSMVLDRQNKIVYACISPRTNEEVLRSFCDLAGYQAITFHAIDENSLPIYHTNVMMCVGSGFAVVCTDTITDANEKQALTEALEGSGKELVDITYAQMNQFAGNMLEVKSEGGDTLIVMSKNAFSSLTYEQTAALSKYGELVYADINTIETNGGGSARCMMAEVHLPER